MNKLTDKEMDQRFGYDELDNDDAYEKLVEANIYLDQIAADSAVIRWAVEIIGVLLIILIWRIW